jgi:UDP-N-acetylglucosamine--dolichyl-phosphate N-acetylglucosaminephosphotransferase
MLESLFIILLFGFFITFLSMPALIAKMRRKGIVGIDVHKKGRKVVPEMGGIAVLIGLVASVLVALIIMPEKSNLLISFLATTLIAGIIGVIDDFKALSAKIKPFLTFFAGIPIIILGTYVPYMVLPIVGPTRLYVVYPFIILLAIAVSSNAVNMMDPFNGTMSGSCTIITIGLIISALILGQNNALILCVTLIGPLLALFYFNRYPSKVFSGDVGSLSIGAALASIAILGRIEVVTVVAFMPQIMNAFYGLGSIGRLYERREVSRPITILDDNKLIANTDPKAPITLARLILARDPLNEKEAIRLFFIFSTISCALF